MEKKTIIVFKTNHLIKSDKREKLRQELKQHLKEGVVVLDGMFEWPQLINIPADCEYDVVVDNLYLEEVEDDSREN